MSLEDDVKALTVAVTGLKQVIEAGGGGAAATAATKPRGRPPGTTKAVTLDEVKAVAKKLMDEKGRPVAVNLIAEHGADQLANLDPAKYSAFIAAAEVLLAAAPEPAEDANAEL